MYIYIYQIRTDTHTHAYIYRYIHMNSMQYIELHGGIWRCSYSILLFDGLRALGKQWGQWTTLENRDARTHSYNSCLCAASKAKPAKHWFETWNCEDRGKVVFLDVDGVLRPARAGLMKRFELPHVGFPHPHSFSFCVCVPSKFMSLASLAVPQLMNAAVLLCQARLILVRTVMPLRTQGKHGQTECKPCGGDDGHMTVIWRSFWNIGQPFAEGQTGYFWLLPCGHQGEPKLESLNHAESVFLLS